MITAAVLVPLAMAGVVLVVAATAAMLGPGLRGPQRADAAYWNASAGVVVTAIVVAIFGQAVPAWLPLLIVFTVALMVAAAVWLRWYWRRRRATERRRRAEQRRRRAMDEHDRVLRRWLAYEVEPDKQIDYPQLRDIENPRTAVLTRSMARAARMRDTAQVGDYEAAVVDLQKRLDAALGTGDPAGDVPDDVAPDDVAPAGEIQQPRGRGR